MEPDYRHMWDELTDELEDNPSWSASDTLQYMEQMESQRRQTALQADIDNPKLKRKGSE